MNYELERTLNAEPGPFEHSTSNLPLPCRRRRLQVQSAHSPLYGDGQAAAHFLEALFEL